MEAAAPLNRGGREGGEAGGWEEGERGKRRETEKGKEGDEASWSRPGGERRRRCITAPATHAEKRKRERERERKRERPRKGMREGRWKEEERKALRFLSAPAPVAKERERNGR